MIIPERQKGIRSFRVPRLFLNSFFVLLSVGMIVLGVFTYDYWKIIQQVFENKNLSIENRQLREQIQLFQIKINSLDGHIERIENFEKKLRIITGLEKIQASPEIPGQKSGATLKERRSKKRALQKLYEQKIAANFGLTEGHDLARTFSPLAKSTFDLANEFSDFDLKYEELSEKMSSLERSIHEIDTFLLNRRSFLDSTPTLIPVKGWITSYYGPRISPTSGGPRMHEGIDIGARPGTQILAPADGIVTFAGTRPGFGKFISVDHGYGIETAFAHAKTVIVKSGMKVKRGATLALVGNTGLSTGPHLHYEVRVNGTPVDPLFYALNETGL